MPKRLGKCTNYASCQLAYKNADIETENGFVCPECGQPLRETAPVAGPSGAPGKALLFGGIGVGALVLLTGAFFLFKTLLHRPAKTAAVEQTAPVSETPAPPETPVPVTPSPATPEPAPPVPVTPKVKPITPPVIVETPAPPTPKPAEEEEKAAAIEVVDYNPQSEENKIMRAEVLKRIDSIPNLKPSERSGLYVRVNKAKVMMKMITIPFAVGQRALSPRVAESVCEVTHAPQVQKLVRDPSVVFVILGFADTLGSAENGLKLSTARAEAVTDSLRERCKLGNRMQPVGMGSSEFFGSDKKGKNRVAEVWAVIP